MFFLIYPLTERGGGFFRRQWKERRGEDKEAEEGRKKIVEVKMQRILLLLLHFSFSPTFLFFFFYFAYPHKSEGEMPNL